MKKIILALVLIFIMYSCVINGIAFAENDVLCEKFVRVHILANSDSPFDQGIKISLRDYIFEKYKNEFATFDTKEKTLEFLKNNQENMEKEINKYLNYMKCDYKGKIEISKGNFQKKAYGNILLPKGIYDSVRITLGKGNGENFFCVMFPPMCIEESVTVDTKLNDIVTEKEEKILSGKITYKSKIAELIKGML